MGHIFRVQNVLCCLPQRLQCCMQYHIIIDCVITGLGVGRTEAPFINFSIRDMFGLVRVPVRFFDSHCIFHRCYCSSALATPAAYKHVIQQVTGVLKILKN